MKYLPQNPGVYFFKDADNRIIYIGKAKNLKKRVNSYFQKNDLDPKTKALVRQIKDIDFMVTDTEAEALILENLQVKKHKPKYNIDLKDDKHFAFIRLTDEKISRLVIARDKNQKGEYFGPFVSAEKRDIVLKMARNIFRLCTKKNPKRACLRYHIGLCSGICENKVSMDDYHEQIRDAQQFLKGNNNALIKDLKSRMKKSSESLEFEKAKVLRDRISALEYLDEKQKIENSRNFDQDVINYLVTDKTYLTLFNIHKGVLDNKKEFIFDGFDVLEEFIVQYYSENPVPKEIILPEKVDPAINEFLEYKSKVKIIVPKKGEKLKLLQLVKKNIKASHFGNIAKVDALQDVLGIAGNVIECFDISHLSGTSTVGSMVSFRNGRPDKNNYRRFRIRTVEGIDDARAIGEVVRRRYFRLREEKKDMPDLVLIDGGRAQLNAAYEQIARLGLSINVISIAKRFEELYFPGKEPIMISRKSTALRYLQEIRDEAHRFAITYNKLLREKKVK